MANFPQVPPLPLNHSAPVKDSTLVFLVKKANSGAELPLMIIVDGQIVSGVLISGANYCTLMEKRFSSGNGDANFRGQIAEYFKNLGDETYSNDDKDLIPTNYLHMKDISIMKGDGYQTNLTGGLFRIAIDRISGYNVGRPS